MFIYLKLLSVSVISLSILYNIISINIIKKYSSLKETPHLNRYLPSFFKGKILMLYEISQLEHVEKDLLINHIIKSTLFMFILLLMVIIIFILF